MSGETAAVVAPAAAATDDAAKELHHVPPGYEAVCVANITGHLFSGDAEGDPKGNVLFERKGWSVVIGWGQAPVELEHALCTMKINEHRYVHANVDDVKVVYSVELLSVTNVKPSDFKGAERISEAIKRKDKGNVHFVEENWERAFVLYQCALEFVVVTATTDDTTGDQVADAGFDTDELKTEARKVRVALFNNLAQVLINMEDYSEAINCCNKCLEADEGEHNVKALFRRSKAHSCLNQWAEAKADLQRIIDVDPENKAATEELAVLSEKEANSTAEK